MTAFLAGAAVGVLAAGLGALALLRRWTKDF